MALIEWFYCMTYSKSNYAHRTTSTGVVWAAGVMLVLAREIPPTWAIIHQVRTTE